MTDADVDGSHIRTLLLTFFFRQMRELVDRGHIFIAQPPLYKIRKGKHEQYLKDDDELGRYQTHIALEGASLYVNAEAPPISGDALDMIVKQYNSTYAIVNRLNRLYPSEVLEAMIFTRELNIAELKEESVTQWVAELSATMLRIHPKTSTGYQLSATKDRERNIYLPHVRQSFHGLTKDYQFNMDFFNSGEYKAIVRLGSTLAGLIEDGAYVQRGEKKQAISSFAEALTWLTADAMKGHYLQRYKGLGEMNPEQLWETTMDPESRRMLQVTIEDAIAADQLFNTLMGDQVDPRREFIEANALAAQNLDI